MTNASSTIAHDFNQRSLLHELARLRAALQAEEFHEPAPDGGEVSAIQQLCVRFGLTPFERDVLLLCAGVELDSALAELCHKRTGKGGATFSLALAALAEPHWSALLPVRPLRALRLIELDDAPGLVQGRLRIDERVLHFLVGLNYLDRRLHGMWQRDEPAQLMAASQHVTALHIARELMDRELPCSVVLGGSDLDGHRDVAAVVARELGLALYSMRASELPTHASELEAFAALCERELALLQGALLLRCECEPPSAQTLQLFAWQRFPIFLSALEQPRLEAGSAHARIEHPRPEEQRALWRELLPLGRLDSQTEATLDGVASQFRLSARTIRAQRGELAQTEARGEAVRRLVAAACRSGTSLDQLAQRVDERASWDELILPDATKATLQRLAAQLRHRMKVYGEWGFAGQGARGLGTSALFHGESGTGKTMAAEVLAHTLGLDLYRIDLASLISKYIGETEKNLRRVFDAAEQSGAVLLFDEADALFGKRSEVKDSHDRHANIEVSYLLQRMETYRGLAILTSNLKSSIDAAFHRRLRFVLHFPFPDQNQRESLWRSAFPKRAPLATLDYGKLARLHVSGGSIRNIALGAAFEAAEEGGAVTMAHLLRSAHYEASKRERALSEAEIKGWV